MSVRMDAASEDVTYSGDPATGGIRICLLIPWLGRGGTEKQVALLAHGLHERGIDVSVIVLFGAGAHDEELRRNGVSITYLGFKARQRAWRRWPANFLGLLRLVRELQRLRPDVLHAFLVYGYVLAAPAVRLARVPVLVAGRRSLAPHRQGHPLRNLVERAATGVADLLIANADAVASMVHRQEHVSDDKVLVVYNGLPESAFDPAPPASVDTELPVIVCVANFWRYKGHRYLLDAVGRLGERGLPCTLVLVGRRPVSEPLERAELERQARDLDIDVRFLGPIADVERLLARANVVVMPSLTEGMSNAVMEAMAAGRPVVATDVGGTPELLRTCGVLVPPCDSEALADGIARLLSDTALADRLGADARTWARENLTAAAMVDRHLQIYRGLLAKKRAAPRRG